MKGDGGAAKTAADDGDHRCRTVHVHVVELSHWIGVFAGAVNVSRTATGRSSHRSSMCHLTGKIFAWRAAFR
jgi:hypothetical protein